MSCCNSFFEKSPERQPLAANGMQEELSKAKDIGRVQGCFCAAGCLLCLGGGALFAANYWGLIASLAELKTQTYIAAGVLTGVGAASCGTTLLAESLVSCISNKCSSKKKSTNIQTSEHSSVNVSEQSHVNIQCCANSCHCGGRSSLCCPSDYTPSCFGC